MPFVTLPDRTLVTVTGPEAEHLLQNVITTDLEKLAAGEAKPGALLTPQGKILFDFLVSRAGPDGFRLDLRRDIAQDFARRMMLYKLRAKAEIAVQDQTVVAAGWGTDSGASQSDSTTSDDDSIWVRDTRFRLEPVWRGYSLVPPPLTPPFKGEGGVSASALEVSGVEASGSPSPLRGGVRGILANADAYTRLRIANAVAESGSDYALFDVFPHDILLDQNDGVGFGKGCYVGQEVVSRMKHRGTARRRLLLVQSEVNLPASGTELLASGKPIGVLGSASGRTGLAITRIDKVKAAMDADEPIMANGVSVQLSIPSWANFTFPEGATDADE